MREAVPEKLVKGAKMVGEAGSHGRGSGTGSAGRERAVGPTEVVAAANQVDMGFDSLDAAIGTAGAASKGSQMSAKGGVEAFDVSGIDGGTQPLRGIEQVA